MSDTNEKVVQFVKVAGETLARAEAREKAAAEAHADAVKFAETLVTHLCQASLLAEDERDSAMEKLSSHRGALELAFNLTTMAADGIRAKAARTAAEGRGETVDSGSAGVVSSPTGRQEQAKRAAVFVGGRRSPGDLSEAQKAFISRSIGVEVG